MGLIRLIKSLFAPKMPSIGNTEPVCPYCAYRLDKMPGRKKKCPGCGQPILVRTRPSDQKRILIREDQDLQIREQWAIVNGDHKWFLAERKRFDAERENLRKRFGREPPKNDVEWAQLNRALLKHARDSDWGLYRSDRLTMGDIRRKEGRHPEALDLYFEVCYLDLNGPINCGTGDPEILDEGPPFNPTDASLAPGVVRYIERILKSQKLSTDDVRTRFHEVAAKVRSSLHLPVSPEQAWSKLADELG